LKNIPRLVSTMVLTPFVMLAPALAESALPAFPYASAFDTGLPAINDTSSPTRWQQANADVARNARGHMDILRWEATNPNPRAMDWVPPASGNAISPSRALTMALESQPELLGRSNSNTLAQVNVGKRLRQVALEVQRAWVDAVTAQQALGLQRQLNDTAIRGLELGQRMVQAGNWSLVPLLQQQSIVSATSLQLAQAQQQAFTSKERLIRLLGVIDPASVQIPDTLPALPNAALVANDLEAQALRNNPVLALAALEAQRAKASVSAQDQQRWKEAARQAIEDVTASKPAHLPALGALPTSAPLLNTTRLVLSHDLAEAAQAQAHARELEVNTRSQAREAYFRYRTALDVAQHQVSEGVRIATAQQDETQTRYNGMIQGTWDLLASARARIQSTHAAVQAQRDFWMAHMDLQAVLAGADVNFSSPSTTGGADASTSQGH
jgi:outer membrane protein TolC